MGFKSLKERIYEVALNALSQCYHVQYSVVDTITINLPEVKEDEAYIQTSKGNYVLSTDGYVLTTKNT